ncbi:MAG TPA: DeoR/GlpR transcriptional regulator [Clostridiaceae bacterium]|nr:DeoR/GlpR transcriptional regulator [Clostridiaceae bacterium]
MKDDVYFVEDRRIKIKEIIDKNGKATVEQLCEILDVSKSTIRTDLKTLNQAGLVQRTHGGAIKISERQQVGSELCPSAKLEQQLLEKKAIARRAADLVSDGDTIAVMTGTTTYEFIKQLNNKKNLTIISNDIRIVSWLEENSPHSIYIIGGMIRKGFHYMIFAYEEITNLNVDKLFFSCDSYNLASGATIPDYQLAFNTRAMLKKSTERYLLCISSKVGKTSFAKLADSEEITKVIVDEKIPSYELKKIIDINRNNVIVAKM